MELFFSCAVHGGSLVWLPELGWGYANPDSADFKYDKDYFQHYVSVSNTAMGERLTAARLEIVKRHTDGEVVDIGIGAGLFVERRGACTFGFDINQASVNWLKERGLFIDPYKQVIDSATFWDSLEHIVDPRKLLDNIKRFAFVSMPIYDDVAHLLKSKHFKKGEHVYYFTFDGLIRWMKRYGFECIENNRVETDLGRKDIGSFVFRRTP